MTAEQPATGADSRPAAGSRRLDGVLFDIDDTLVDTAGAFAVALTGIAGTYLPHLDASRHAEVLAHWRADAEGRYARYAAGEIDYRTQRMARANDLHATFGGLPLDDSAFDAWTAQFERGFAGAWQAHPDVVAVLDALERAGLRIGALSNAAEEYQRSKLAAIGVAERVPLLVGVDTLGVGKPDPRVFAEACRRLGTEPRRTAYVGDELDVDARAAVRAGLVGVWLDRHGPRRVPVDDADIATAQAEGVLVVRTLEGLVEVLTG